MCTEQPELLENFPVSDVPTELYKVQKGVTNESERILDFVDTEAKRVRFFKRKGIPFGMFC